jgi:ABC-type transport system substrate-binding protein/class 3 adenylate cyclase
MDRSSSDRETDRPAGDETGAGVRTFLIADVRGYTRYTQEQGDEAAARLAGEFAASTRSGVGERGGEVIELRGDEALAVFGSARQALRAAIELQGRYAELRAANPGLPLHVGIGVDAGEAVPLEHGYRGAALNLAARLCSNAGPGEVLASESVVHLAGKLDGLEYRDAGRLRMKGLAQPVRAHRVVVAGAPPSARRRKPHAAASGGARGRLRWIAGAGVALAALVLALVLALGRSSSALGHIDANAAGAIGPGNNRVVAQVQVGSGPGRVASGAGSLWVANVPDSTVSRVNTKTFAVEQTIAVDLDPTALAFGDGALWVACSGSRKLDRINPGTNTVVQRIPVGNGPSGVAISPGTVWVTNRFDDTVSEIDASSGQPRRTFDAGASPGDIAYGFGVLWIANESSSTVTRLDPHTGARQPVLVGNGPAALTVGAGSVWAANSLDATVSRIDPGSNVAVAAIPVSLGPSSLLFDHGAIWVADADSGDVTRLSPAANRVVKRILVGNAPQGLAAAGGRIWVTARAGSSVHVGGTLRVDMPADLIGGVGANSVDQAFGDTPHSWELLSLTGDGLVNFKHVSGVDGATPVPDLATSLPVPTDAGRTYTFQLRPGIKYSNGVPVRASDLRRALERDFRLGSGGAYSYAGLLGAKRCSKSRCDLSRGVVADDGAGTVTLHLTAPDPNIFYKLALPFARPVPPVPIKPLPVLGVPGTGPYKIASFTRSKIVLVRNPHFHVWSTAAQPGGYPDRIVWNLTGSAGQQLTAVERGTADFADLAEIKWRSELGTRYAAQVHVFPDLATFALFLNTRMPPFNSLVVRQALNDAIDRRKALEAFGGTVGGTVTCQILPAGNPGYAPYCPYTQKPGKFWSAPDLTLARKLVEKSRTRGEKVVVWTIAHPSPLALGRLAVATLDELGYRASLKLIPSPGPYFQAVQDPRSRAQIGFAAWGADYPAASDFLSNYTCSAAVNGMSQLCDRALDRAYAAALVAQGEDPPANASWATVDRRVVDLAAWVPLVNSRRIVVVSPRVGNVQVNPSWGPLLDQLWVK